MRILFAGSPEIAVPSLLALAARHRLAGVLTNRESGQGRGLHTRPTPVAEALRTSAVRDVPVFTFDTLGSAARAAIAPLNSDILVSFAYGRLFGPKFLSLFPKGGVNVHPSPLPAYRGCSPIPFTILNREPATAVVVQRLALEMDSGDILGRIHMPLTGRETSADLTAAAAELGATLLVEVLAKIERGEESAQPQSGVPSYCRMLGKDDGRVDWTRSSLDIDARVRAYFPWPGAFTTFRGLRLAILESFPYPGDASSRAGTFPDGVRNMAVAPGTILELDRRRGLMVQTIDGTIALRRLQLPAKKALSFGDFANGVRDLAGTVLGDRPPEERRAIP